MRYATKKEVKELSDALLRLIKQVKEIAIWQAYYSIREHRYDISPKLRKEIVEQSKGHITHTLFKQLFPEVEA